MKAMEIPGSAWLLPMLVMVACSGAATQAPAGAATPIDLRVPSATTRLAGDGPVGVGELVPPMLEDEHYSDKFTFEFTFPDAQGASADAPYEVYYSLFVTNLGPGQHKLKANSRVVTPDGQRLTDETKRGGGKWRTAADRLAIEAGAYRLSGTPERLEMSAEGEGYAFHLTITPDVAPWRPPQGTLTLASNPSRYVHTAYTSPRARAEGTITVKGVDVPVTGYGYGIHSVTNTAPYEMAWRWLSFRSVQPDWTLFFKHLVTSEADGKRETAWLVIGGPDGLRFSADDVSVLPDEFTPDTHPNGYPIPKRLVIHARSGADEAHILLRADELRSRSEPLKGLNTFVRMMAEKVTQPVNLEYYAPFAARVRIAGEDHAFDARGNYEINFLNK